MSKTNKNKKNPKKNSPKNTPVESKINSNLVLTTDPSAPTDKIISQIMGEVNSSVKEEPTIKIFSLGGLGVVGMNIYIVECDDEIIIIDSGILFAEEEIYGVDYIIPDFTYLVENESKIVGLFITHGHEDHIGSIPFLLKKVKVPAIYSSGLGLALIRNKLSEFPNLKYNLIEFKDNSVYNYKNFTISFFRTNHSIPDSFGIAIKTYLGYIINTGDFKFDFTPIGHATDYYKLAKYGEEGVLCLLSDSTNAGIKNFSLSERKISQSMKQLFSQIEGRIIVATFASNVYRVQQIIEASVSQGRKIAVFGHSMDKNIEAALKLRYIKVSKDNFISSRELNKYPDQKVTILCTGSQGEPLAALSRIANGTHKQIKLLPNDTIIYSSKPIPGNEQYINRNINKMIKFGANVIRNTPLTDTHTTGHASVEEIKLMLSLTKPKYFMPVHGEYHMLKQHANVAIEMGIKKENCFCLDAGDVLTFNYLGKAKVIKEAVHASDVYLDNNLSDVSSNILKERRILADEGMISLVFTINKEKQIIAPTKFISKGFMDLHISHELSTDLIAKAEEILLSLLNQNRNTIVKMNIIKMSLLNQLAGYIYSKTHRRPFLIPIVTLM